MTAHAHRTRDGRTASAYAVALFLSSLLCLLSACAAGESPRRGVQPPSSGAEQVSRHGELPASGRIVLRSGMAWMDENSPLFQSLAASLGPSLTARGLTVTPAPASVPAPYPAGTAPGAQAVRAAPNTSSGALRLASYALTEAEAVTPHVPAVITAGTAATSPEAVFARSQLRGAPAMTGNGTIPGRLPSAMRLADPALADYTLVCRFTSVLADHPDPLAFGSPTGLITAAGPIRGVGTLGYGSPAPASAPRAPYGGGPTDFSKGREGPLSGPPDFFGREADLRARDFQTKYGPQPHYARPPATPEPGVSYPPGRLPASPKPPLPGDNRLPAAPLPPASPGGVRPVPAEPGATLRGPARAGGGAAIATVNVPPPIMGYLLEMECYSLAPARQGGEPALVWSARVRRAGESAPGLASALPAMARVAVESASW